MQIETVTAQPPPVPEELKVTCWPPTNWLAANTPTYTSQIEVGGQVHEIKTVKVGETPYFNFNHAMKLDKPGIHSKHTPLIYSTYFFHVYGIQEMISSISN